MGTETPNTFMHWLKNGVSNHIHRICLDDGSWCTEDDLIAKSVVDYFMSFLNSPSETENFDNSLFQSVISIEDNCILTKIPNETKNFEVLSSMNADSVAGSNGYTTRVFQKSWSIIKTGIINAIAEFFRGSKFPKLFTSTSIVLIPKKTNFESWGDFCPISLCTFFNKLISKILTKRLAVVLPKLYLQINQVLLKRELLLITLY